MFMQIATVEVPEEYMGPVVELLGKRRGQMFDMQGLGFVFSPLSIFLCSLHYCCFSLYDCLYKYFSIILLLHVIDANLW